LGGRLLQFGEGSFSGEYPDPAGGAVFAPRDGSSAHGTRWVAAASGRRLAGTAREERRSAEMPRRVADAAAMVSYAMREEKAATGGMGEGECRRCQSDDDSRWTGQDFIKARVYFSDQEIFKWAFV
jgi:hypothetical protein